jgi:hypothetical protein
MLMKMGCHKGYMQKPRAHKHHDIAAHSVLYDDHLVAKTAALVVGNNNVALRPLLEFFRYCGTLVLGLTTICYTFAVSCPQAIFF